MDFSIYLRPAGPSYDDLLDLAQYADNNKYFGVFLNDHVHGFKQKGKEPYLEAWTVMSAIGVQTTNIRIGHIVLFNSLRNPAVLAKSIASLDNLIQGRYECMIGAGWNQNEYNSYDLMESGRGMPSAKEKVDRFKESLLIIKGMLSNEEFSFDGSYWRLKNAINIPQPIQKNMRISVGAKKTRMLKIASKYADGLNISSDIPGTESIIEKMGEELAKLEKSKKDYFFTGFYSIYIAKSEKHYKNLAFELSKNFNKPIGVIKDNYLIGTPEILVNKLNHLGEMGIKMIVMSLKSELKPFDLIELKENYNYFKDTVINRLIL